VPPHGKSQKELGSGVNSSLYLGIGRIVKPDSTGDAFFNSSLDLPWWRLIIDRVSKLNRPNYLGIGAIKAGTTWASEMLSAHPDVFLAHGKELHYFSHQYSNGLDWYLSKFSSSQSHSALGEFSVTYMNGSIETPRRIFDFNPEIKLIVCIRNPVERAFSQYRWEKQMGSKLPEFREALKIRPDLLQNGCYSENLGPYWDLFPANQFFYIQHHEISINPGAVCRDLYQFLGVCPSFSPESRDKVIGETIQPVSQSLENLRIRVHRSAMENGLEKVITLYRQLGLSTLYRRLNNDERKKEALSTQEADDILQYFESDMRTFKLQTGLDVC
jgi:hypothetical protein